jgi:hypothetical protein
VLHAVSCSALCVIILRTLMVSISLSVRFHDMMAIVQGRNGLFRCVVVKECCCCWCSIVELPKFPTYAMTLVRRDSPDRSNEDDASLIDAGGWFEK